MLKIKRETGVMEIKGLMLERTLDHAKLMLDQLRVTQSAPLVRERLVHETINYSRRGCSDPHTRAHMSDPCVGSASSCMNSSHCLSLLLYRFGSHSVSILNTRSKSIASQQHRLLSRLECPKLDTPVPTIDFQHNG